MLFRSRTKKLPVVLSRDEVWRILDAVRIDAYRVCLTTIYTQLTRELRDAALQPINSLMRRG